MSYFFAFILLQLDQTWCLPSQTGNIENAEWEQGILLIIFLIMGYLFYRRMPGKIKLSSVSSKRYDLLNHQFFNQLVKSKYFSPAIRIIPVLLFLLVIITGLMGRKYTSMGAGFTWLFWWTLLIFFVAFAGKIFCAICPWDFFSNFFQFNGFYKKSDKIQGIHIKWPKALSNVYLAVFLFIGLTWLELGFDVTRNSYATAILGLSVLGIAVLTALVFEKRSFCRYVCPVGRISGLYAQISPIELRPRDLNVCTSCESKDCIRGTVETTPCPTGEIPYQLNQNTYCTLCTECVRSCQKDNMTINVRPLGVDLNNLKTSRSDESILAVVMLALTFFHGLTMTTFWFDITSFFGLYSNLTYLQSFTVLMALILVLSLVVVKVFEWSVGWMLNDFKIGLNLAYIFIPITLGYHLGHNAMHLFTESPYLVQLVNDPFGFDWNLFGWAGFKAAPLLGADTLRFLQLLVITIGFYYSVKTLRNRVEQLTEDTRNRRILYLSHTLFLLLIAAMALWFVYQPMLMKSVERLL